MIDDKFDDVGKLLTFILRRSTIEVVSPNWGHLEYNSKFKLMSKQQNPLGQNIKSLREKHGLSQDRLAKLADVANNTIIKIEQGENPNPTLETLKKIAKALDVSIDDLTQ